MPEPVHCSDVVFPGRNYETGEFPKVGGMISVLVDEEFKLGEVKSHHEGGIKVELYGYPGLILFCKPRLIYVC